MRRKSVVYSVKWLFFVKTNLSFWLSCHSISSSCWTINLPRKLRQKQINTDVLFFLYLMKTIPLFFKHPIHSFTLSYPLRTFLRSSWTLPPLYALHFIHFMRTQAAFTNCFSIVTHYIYLVCQMVLLFFSFILQSYFYLLFSLSSPRNCPFKRCDHTCGCWATLVRAGMLCFRGFHWFGCGGYGG